MVVCTSFPKYLRSNTTRADFSLSIISFFVLPTFKSSTPSIMRASPNTSQKKRIFLYIFLKKISPIKTQKKPTPITVYAGTREDIKII